MIGGVGLAVTKDPERFQRLYQTSPRFRRLMTMVEHAFKYSDLAVLEAYIDLFDPGFWLRHAARRSDEPRVEEPLELAAVMERRRCMSASSASARSSATTWRSRRRFASTAGAPATPAPSRSRWTPPRATVRTS